MKVFISGIALLLCTIGHAQRFFDVYFDFDKSQLTRAAKAKLDSFIEAERPNLSRFSIRLDGHCDSRGSDAYNDRLSKQRVLAVKKYFKRYGFSESNIGEETGHGKRQPLNDNITDDERQLNRRVQIGYTELYPPGITTIGSLIADTATTVGSNIVLRNINFVGGRDEFLPESITMLDELLDAMRSHPNLVIRVEGHICCQEGDVDGVNLATGLRNLSSARANAVMGYLISNNISKDRVTAIGFGHRNPIHPYPEQSEIERTENRRVEIKIIQK